MNKLKTIVFFSLVCSACNSIKSQDAHIKTNDSEEPSLIESVIHELGLDSSKNQIDFAITKISPINSEETIVVIPQVVNEEDDEYELNSNIVIVDNSTGKISHKYFESSKTNGWVSNVIFIYEIAIGKIAYKLSPTKSAFGVIVKWRSNSQSNPYYDENISLFIKEENDLKKC